MPEEDQAVGKCTPVTARGLPVIGYNIQSHQHADVPGPALVNYNCAIPPQPLSGAKPTTGQVAKLIGEKCTLKCNLSGHAVTVLLDSGAQVCIISLAWKEKHFPQQQLHPLSELMGDRGLDLTAANGEPVPYDG